MAVGIDDDHYVRWLDRNTPDVANLTELLTPCPADELEVYPVSPTVNRASVEGPELIKAVGERQPPDRLVARLES